MPRPRLSKQQKRRRQLIRSLRNWDRRDLLLCVVIDHYSIALFHEDITSRTNSQLDELLRARFAMANHFICATRLK